MSVSKDDVIMAYRLLLGREPESEAAIDNNMKAANDWQGLREHFMRSREFIDKVATLTNRRVFFPLDAPKLDIDTDAPDDQLSFMIAKIKEAWSHLGKTRPFFSVLTNPKFLPDEFERNAKEYWDSGEREAGRVQRMLERHGFDLANKTCVEYGCGTGRVTMGLAKRCAHVHAYDISLGNMKHGKQRAKEIGIGNITFHEISDIVGMLEPCDFFYSRIVFQHNPPPVITRLVEKALGSLNSEGIAIFQVPTYLFGYRFEIDEWIKADHALDMQMHCLPQRRIFEIIAQGGCVPLEIMEDGSTGSTKFRSNTFIIRKSI